MNAPLLTRRQFTAALGGIVLSFTLAPEILLGQAQLPGSLQTNRMLDAWLRINPDGSVTVFTGKVELGQGIVTALAQIAAEELDVPLARITMISGDTARTPNEGQTAGSQSVEQSGTALHLAGAEVRALLIDLAATKLGASADTLTVTDGVINAPDGRKVSYGELAAAVRLRTRDNKPVTDVLARLGKEPDLGSFPFLKLLYQDVGVINGADADDHRHQQYQPLQPGIVTVEFCNPHGQG